MIARHVKSVLFVGPYYIGISQFTFQNNVKSVFSSYLCLGDGCKVGTEVVFDAVG